MELIPILSLIVLVATISTFILAVGAYILYKIRERKGKTAEAPQPSSIPAELVAPTPVIAEQHTATGGRRTYEQPYPTRERTGDYQRTQQQQRVQSGPEMRPTYVSSPPPPTRPTAAQQSRYTGSGESRYSTSDRKKFMRYTSEGYVEPEKEQVKKKKEDQLKWR